MFALRMVKFVLNILLNSLSTYANNNTCTHVFSSRKYIAAFKNAHIYNLESELKIEFPESELKIRNPEKRTENKEIYL